MHVKSPWVACLAVSLLALAAPAAADPVTEPDGLGEAVSSPMRDLNLIGKDTPPQLKEAVAAPYATPQDCRAIATELADLDAALGPDIDGKQPDKPNFVTNMALDAVRSAVGLPFRGVVRRLSGAEKRDQKLKQAILAGMIRRGYLKGASHSLLCGVHPQPLRASAELASGAGSPED